jgi:hypothetical protein
MKVIINVVLTSMFFRLLIRKESVADMRKGNDISNNRDALLHKKTNN